MCPGTGHECAIDRPRAFDHVFYLASLFCFADRDSKELDDFLGLVSTNAP